MWEKKIITDIELLSPAAINECFENGVSPNLIFKRKPLINELIGGYMRGSNFSDCVKLFIQYGLNIPEGGEVLFAVLSNDTISLRKHLNSDKKSINAKYTLDTAFTEIREAGLLHICSEFNLYECAKILLEYGANANLASGIDKHGFGGQSPIFHAVNQPFNFSYQTLEILLQNNADPLFTVKGLIWGKEREWETFIPSVNPISYTMMGLLKQFQRNEIDIYNTVQRLMQKAYGINYYPSNIPNKYLK